MPLEAADRRSIAALAEKSYRWRWDLSQVRKVLLLPRYTTLAGHAIYHTAPIEVRGFSGGQITVWRGNEIGVLSQFSVSVEQSVDLLSWKSDLTVLQPAAGAEVTEEYAFRRDWLRLAVAVLGQSMQPDPAVTCWAVGTFVERES